MHKLGTNYKNLHQMNADSFEKWLIFHDKLPQIFLNSQILIINMLY